MQPPEVIVIGGGLAGLAAALTLQEAGLDVLVLVCPSGSGMPPRGRRA
jgi:flavin-dependent dehydrogenase